MSRKLLLKILLVNSAVFALLLFSCEIIYRLLVFAKSCTAQCDYSRLSLVSGSQKTKWYMGVSQFHHKLGYEPTKNVDLVINAPGWNSIKLSTDANGFRKSFPNPAASLKVLTVGDSFTWGDEVSNADTWQSCLNRKLSDIEFFNAGVMGYGTNQALMRAKDIIKNTSFDYVILQTLVGHDFKRDQLDIKSGFVKPYLSKSGGKIVVMPPPPVTTPNTKYGTKDDANLGDYFWLILRFWEIAIRQNYFVLHQ